MLLIGQIIAADSPVRPPTAQTALKTLKKAHPRLILTDKRLAELKELMKRDRLLKKCYKDVIKQADEYCTKKPLAHNIPDGVRLLSVSRECVSRIYALGLAWRLTDDEKYAVKARKNLLAVCAFKDWNPKHFLDNAEMSHAVAVGYDWLYHYLDDESREKIRGGLIKNGLEPGLWLYHYLDAESREDIRSGLIADGLKPGLTRRYEGMGTRHIALHFNWNLVCNGGMMIGALAIAETDPKYAMRIIPKAVGFLPNALSTYAPDGAWPEGPGYWWYATTYAAYGLAALDTALGTDFGLSKIKGLSQAGLPPIYTTGPTGLYLNFADVGSNKRRKNLPCIFWLARKFNKPMLAEAEREMLTKRGAVPQDFIWYVPSAKAPKPSLDKYFRGPVEVAVFRSAWNDPNALFVGVKAGFNQVNHGHLDLGGFEIDALGVRWARDLGAEDYNLPGYWNMGPKAKRWTYYRLSSVSHNVPVLGGKNQDVHAETKITKFKTAPSKGFAVLDLTSAYKGFATKVTRGVAIVGNRKAVLVQDEFEIARSCEVAWGMTTDAKIAADKKGGAVLTIGDKKMTAQILSPAGAVFTVESAQQKPPLKSNKGVKRLMVRLKDQKGPVRITVFLAPVRPDGKPARPPVIKPLKQW